MSSSSIIFLEWEKNIGINICIPIQCLKNLNLILTALSLELLNHILSVVLHN